MMGAGISRRTFLRISAGTAGFVATVPALSGKCGREPRACMAKRTLLPGP